MKKFYITFLIFLFILGTTTFNEVSGSMLKKTIAIDLDGVLDEYDGIYNKDIIPDIKSGAKEFIIKLSIKNFEVYWKE